METKMNNDLFKSLPGYRPTYKEIFRVISGSTLYGINTPTSDVDYRGAFLDDQKSHFLSRVKQVSDAKSDTVFHELHSLVTLLKNCNPNLIELLFAPEDKCELVTPEFQRIMAARKMFLTQRAYHSFSGYAHSQIKKAKGQNKLFHLAKQFGDKVEPPHLIDYCYIIQDNGKPTPILNVLGYVIDDCKAAKVEHSHNWYRLYRCYGNSKDSGVIKNEAVACQSVSIDEERNFLGLMMVHEDKFEDDKRGHKTYWEWMGNKNPERWKTQESGEIDYDVKNCMHCIRLLMSCESILLNEEPIVVFEGERREMLMAIRQGLWPYEKVIEKADKLMAKCEEAVKQTKLPYGVDQVKVDDMLYDIYSGHWNR